MKRTIFILLLPAICSLFIGCGTAPVSEESPLSSTVSEEVPILETETEIPSSSTISAEALTLAANMPAVSWQALPDWRGYTVTDRYWTESYGVSAYELDEIDTLAGLGFNFIRAPLHMESIFLEGNPDEIDTEYLKQMDRLLEYCAADGIHVCFDLHDMPGFRTNDDSAPNKLFTDEAAQNLFVAFWRFLADWYKDVPSNLLSFNLLNEPHVPEDENLTEDTYSALMLRAIDAIRESSPDRLIFADMLDIPMGTPVYGLANAQIVQSAHPYFLPDGTQVWPRYEMNGFVSQDSGTLLLQGDLREGTELTFTFDSVHLESSFYAIADGKTVASLTLGGDNLGENGCVEIGEAGTEGEWRKYEAASLSVVLTEDCSAVELRQEGGGWYQMKSITIATDIYETELVANAAAVPDEIAPVFVLDEDGTVTAKQEGTLRSLSLWLEDLCRSYRSFTQETGTLVMVQEFGFNNTLPHAVILDAADELLSVLNEYSIPWCSWNGDFGPLIDARDNAASPQEFLHADVMYEELSANWLLDRELMEVFQRYSK